MSTSHLPPPPPCLSHYDLLAEQFSDPRAPTANGCPSLLELDSFPDSQSFPDLLLDSAADFFDLHPFLAQSTSSCIDASPPLLHTSSPGENPPHSDHDDAVMFANACMSSHPRFPKRSTAASKPNFPTGNHSQYLRQRSLQKVSESLRRKQMTRLLYTLRSLLPTDAVQKDRCSIIDKTCDYIRMLEKQLHVLKRKAHSLERIERTQELQFSSGSTKESPNIESETQNFETLSPCLPDGCDYQLPLVRATTADNNVLNISIGCCERKQGLFSWILQSFEQRGLDVIHANRSQRGEIVLYAIHAKAHQSNPLTEAGIDELREGLYAKAASTM